VICNGEPPSRPLLRRVAKQCDIVVAADGGAETARRYGVTPDLIIGDFDSVSGTTRRYFTHVQQQRVSRQDNTDLEKALDELLETGTTHVILLGVTGGRVDFTLGNFLSLWNYDRRMSIRVAGDGWFAVPVRRSLRVTAPASTIVSLLPAGSCSGVTLRGFRYPLTEASLGPGQIAVSNVVRTSPATVRIRRGHLLAIVFHDPLGSW
jgi:thiamine pyrophosphokinase